MRKYFHEDYLLLAFLEILMVKNFLFLEIFCGDFFFLICSLRLFHYEDFFNAQLEAKKLF
jgi:hypothetical protein